MQFPFGHAADLDAAVFYQFRFTYQQTLALSLFIPRAREPGPKPEVVISCLRSQHRRGAPHCWDVVFDTVSKNSLTTDPKERAKGLEGRLPPPATAGLCRRLAAIMYVAFLPLIFIHRFLIAGDHGLRYGCIEQALDPTQYL